MRHTASSSFGTITGTILTIGGVSDTFTSTTVTGVVLTVRALGGGMGTITLDVNEKSGQLVAAKEILEGDELMVISASGAATRVAADEIPVQGRATQGKRVLSVSPGDRVVEVSRVAREREGGALSANSEEIAAEDEAGDTEEEAETE